jgi:hypothetical protein
VALSPEILDEVQQSYAVDPLEEKTAVTLEK